MNAPLPPSRAPKALTLTRTLALTAAFIAFTAFTAAPAVADPDPWHLDRALDAPSWLRLRASHRSRVEHLRDDPRANAAPVVTAWAARTLLSVEAGSRAAAFGVELIDARAYGTDGAAFNTGVIDPLDALQAYVRLRGADVLTAGDTATATLGRQTIDLGSRRLVARNGFRNTINAFTGLHLQWDSDAGPHLQALAVMPVRREPSRADDLTANALRADLENPDALLWALLGHTPPRALAIRWELYLIGLHERDRDDAPSANRQLLTAGVRALRAPRLGALDLQAELIGQLGRARATTRAADTQDLQHVAASAHLAVGFTFDAPARPRLVALYDWASGDADPDDRTHGRFDPLFGARRFEWGPTGLLGVLSRSNLHSPGALTEATAGPVHLMATYRAAWLDEPRDAWAAVSLRDPDGTSGRFVGHLIEASATWSLLPGNLSLELGAAALLHGGFARAVTTPDAHDASANASLQTTFLYTQLTGSM